MTRARVARRPPALLLALAAPGADGSADLLSASGKRCCQDVLRPGFADGPLAASPDGWWPADCGWQRRLFFVPAKHAEGQKTLRAILLKACRAWERLVGEGLAITPQTALPGKGPAMRLVNATLPFFPYGRLAWAQFSALFAQFKLCEAWNADADVKKGGQELCVGADGSDCDCMSVVLDNLPLLFGGLPARAADDSAYLGRLLHMFGQERLQPKETAFQHELGVAGRGEAWGRFLFRQNLSRRSDGFVDQQRAWATAMSEQGFAVAAHIAKERPDATALLTFVGAARGKVEDRSGGKNFAWGAPRTGRFVQTIVTPMQGHLMYPWHWRDTLSRRLARGRRPFDCPGDDAGRCRACAAVATWVELPWAECEKISASLGATIGRPGDTMVAGVSKVGLDTCRVVMNVAVAQSMFDGFLLGEDCSEWYGHSQNELSWSYRLWPIMFHASPLANDIVQRSLLHRELQGYYAIMTELSSHLMCRAEGELAVDFVIPHPGWARLVQQLARIYWLFLNLLPYVRGSSTAGLLLHHGLLLAVFPQARRAAVLTRCVSMLRQQRFPDWDAMGSSVEDWSSEVYPSLFERPISLPCLHFMLFGRDGVLP